MDIPVSMPVATTFVLHFTVSGIGQNSSFYTTDFPAHVDTMHEDTDKLFETEYTVSMCAESNNISHSLQM